MRRVIFGFAALALTALLADSVNASDAFRLLRISGQHVKWGLPEFGTGTTVTYAVIYGGKRHAGSRNCIPTGSIQPLLERSALTRDDFESELAEAFALWSRVADIRFEMVSDAESADILVGSQLVPRGRSYADITLEDAARNGVQKIGSGIVCLNPQLRWVRGMPEDATDEGVLLRYALAHEIGHLLALDHPSARGSLMSFVYDEKVAELQPGDIAGAVALYGPARSDPEVGRDVASGEGTTHARETSSVAADEITHPIPIAFSRQRGGE